MKDLVNGLGTLIAAVAWLMGIVLAVGWWKLLAVFPLYAWYLTVEKLMTVLKLI